MEDTEDVAEAIASSFARRGDAIEHAATVKGAADMLVVQDYDVAILDIGLPDSSGTDVLRLLRLAGDATPVQMLTAQTEGGDRLSALDGGAGDYLIKASDLRKLHARVRALSRRQSAERTGVFEFGYIRFDPADQGKRKSSSCATVASTSG